MTPRDDRDEVLARIRAALGRPAPPSFRADDDAGAPPAAIEEDPADGPPPTRAELAHRFAHECALVGGETRFVERTEELEAAIAAFAAERQLTEYPGHGGGEHEYAVLRAEALLADTGSALVVERDPERRLLPYLPRTCVIIADAAQLHPTLSSSSMREAFEAARRGDRGEAVLITGPSRTADIEKTLVLGAHGPRWLVVFIVGIAPHEVPAEALTAKFPRLDGGWTAG